MSWAAALILLSVWLFGLAILRGVGDRTHSFLLDH